MRWLLFFLLSGGCAVQSRIQICEEKAVVLDHSDLDGCSLLLQTSKQGLLMPLNAAEFNLAPSETMMVSYEIVDAASICMASDQIVKLTCVRRMTGKPCPVEADVQKIPWLEAIVVSQKPNEIRQYMHASGQYYQISFERGDQWFDCEGRLVCDVDSGCALNNILQGPGTLIFIAHR